MIISGLATLVYAIVLFGSRDAYYGLGALAITFIVSIILAIAIARKIDQKLKIHVYR